MREAAVVVLETGCGWVANLGTIGWSRAGVKVPSFELRSPRAHDEGRQLLVDRVPFGYHL